MSWILLLIQIVPAIIQIVQFIRSLILKLPRTERAGAKAELVAVARKHVRRKGKRDTLYSIADRASGHAEFGRSAYGLAHGGAAAIADLEALRQALQARVAKAQATA